MSSDAAARLGCRAARGRGGSSGGRPSRTRGPGRSRRRPRRRRAAPTAGRSRAARRARAGGTAASGPPSRRPRPRSLRRRRPARSAPLPPRSCTPRARCPPSPSISSNPSGKSSSMTRARLLGPSGGNADRDAPEDAQRNALLSFSKKPSSAPVGVRRPTTARTARAGARCSSVRRRGTVTLTSTRWSPRPEALQHGIPLPRRTCTSPGCVPGSNVELERLRRASAPESSRRAPPGRSSGRPSRRCRCRRARSAGRGRTCTRT